jgi:hypothetical protein
MGTTLELLTQADYVLTPCGRPVPPPGYRFVDLPRVIPFHFDNTVGAQPGTPFNRVVSNTANTVFLTRGIVLNSGFRVRLRWPSGRFISSNVLFNQNEQASPMGTGATMLALTEEMPLDPDARISVQISGLDTSFAACDLNLWGVLRYLLKVGDDTGEGRRVARDPAATCLIGYPTISKNNGAGLDLIDDPIETLKSRPRYLCGPNQNIMVPEWGLGNQCTPETPDGWQDEPFTFFSAPIAIPHGGEVYDVPVIVPGGGEDVIVKSLKFFTTYTEDYFAVPVLQIRLPNGFSMTGGDMIPVAYDQNFIPNVFELPVFPTLHLTTGMRVILDAADMLVSGVGTATLVVQFVGVKRRRLS